MTTQVQTPVQSDEGIIGFANWLWQEEVFSESPSEMIEIYQQSRVGLTDQDRISRAVKTVQIAEEDLRAAVTTAHEEHKVSWTGIGEILGVTRQAAWERFTRDRKR